MVEELVDDEVKPRKQLSRKERRHLKQERALDREVEREERRRRSWLRSTLVYKTFYDMVCNRIGVIIAGFGVAMILFTMLYDWLQGNEFSLGTRHSVALAISLVVYFTGMGLEGLRVLSWECEGLESAALEVQVNGEGAQDRRGSPEDHHIPLIPEEAVVELINGRDGEKEI
jgi:hypothetical protein